MINPCETTTTRRERINALIMLLAGADRCNSPDEFIREMSFRQEADSKSWPQRVIDGVAALQEEIAEMERDRAVVLRILGSSNR